MGSLNHLEKILFQIDNLILENKLFDEDELLGSFKVLGGLYLTSCAEKYKLIEPNLSFKKKISKISRAFPTLYEIEIYDQFSQIYPKIIEIRNRFGNEVGLDPLGNLYQKILTKTTKQGKGIVFTPISIIKYILHQIEFPNRYSIKDKQNIIDLSSGSGLFLAQAIDLLIEQNIEKFTVNEIIDYIQNNVIGFDIDPLAVYISKFNLSLILIEQFKERYNLETSFTP
ncbi:MAG: N-6 DNA methylase, partial [Candidatus Heimdallarchaeaceae archaeon]